MRLAFFSILTFIILTLFSCAAPAKEKNRLTDDQLVNLVFDLHLADALIPAVVGTQQDSVQDAVWTRLTEIYKMSEEELRHEIAVLESNPAKHEEIVARVKAKTDELKY